MPEGEDIEFDEDNIDIDEIQRKLQAHLPMEATPTDSSNLPLILNPTPQTDADYKKYVIYIDPENIEFIEHLSINDRKKVVNDILKEQDARIAKQIKIEAHKKFLKHLLVASITFIIGFPLLFYVVNVSMELTIENYKQAQKNFTKLYREKGKIKSNDPSQLRKYKY